MTQHQDSPRIPDAGQPSRRIFLRGTVAGIAATAGLAATGATASPAAAHRAASRTTST